jgi:hypothetical protein
MNVALITHSQQAYVSVALESTAPCWWEQHPNQYITAGDRQTWSAAIRIPFPNKFVWRRQVPQDVSTVKKAGTG